MAITQSSEEELTPRLLAVRRKSLLNFKLNKEQGLLMRDRCRVGARVPIRYVQRDNKHSVLYSPLPARRLARFVSLHSSLSLFLWAARSGVFALGPRWGNWPRRSADLGSDCGELKMPDVTSSSFAFFNLCNQPIILSSLQNFLSKVHDLLDIGKSWLYLRVLNTSRWSVVTCHGGVAKFCFVSF